MKNEKTTWFFIFQKYGKFLSGSFKHFIKHKHLFFWRVYYWDGLFSQFWNSKFYFFFSSNLQLCVKPKVVLVVDHPGTKIVFFHSKKVESLSVIVSRGQANFNTKTFVPLKLIRRKNMMVVIGVGAITIVPILLQHYRI